MKLIPKYKVNDFAIVLKSVFDIEVTKKPAVITECYIEEDQKYNDYSISQRIRYRIAGLWYNQNDIKVVTKTENPEYWL